MSTIARGGCLCGDVRYQVIGAPRVTSLCHCRSCRLACGAPAVAWIMVSQDQLVLERGAPTAFRSSPAIERTFCGRCGTSLTYRDDATPGSVDVLTATLDDPAVFPPGREIWLEHRIAWMVNNPALSQHPRSSRDS